MAVHSGTEELPVPPLQLASNPRTYRNTRNLVVITIVGLGVVFLLVVSPVLLAMYNVERAGALMEQGLAWPEPRVAASLPTERDAGALDAALVQLTTATRWQPKNAHAYRLLGHVYSARQDWARAVEAYEQAATLAPRHPLAKHEAELARDQLRRRAGAILRNEGVSSMGVAAFE